MHTRASRNPVNKPLRRRRPIQKLEGKKAHRIRRQQQIQQKHICSTFRVDRTALGAGAGDVACLLDDKKRQRESEKKAKLCKKCT